MNWTEKQLAEHLEKTGIPSVVPPVDTSAPPFAAPPDKPGGGRLAPDDPQQIEPVTVLLAGEPQGKGRARAFRRGNHIGHYTPEKTRTYEGMIRTAAMEALGNKAPFEDPVEFVLRAVFPVPASWSGKKRDRALTGELKPGKKPDLDNVCKAWNDALNGVVYRDDSLICRMTLDKRYGPQALVVVTVRPLP